jgi:radical SAM superfamily enzyme YgiQ (UPF0313 family)
MKWKKILLLVANYRTTGYDFYDSAFPPLALEYLATYIEDLVEVEILDAKAGNLTFKKVRKKFKEFKPDLVGLTVPVTSAIDMVLLYARIAKEEYKCTTVIGGWHPTLAVEQTLSSPWIDILVRGEGEFAFRELIEKGSSENVSGLSYKENGRIIHNPDRPFLKNLDELKFPARHLVRKYNYKILNMNCDAIETSRGCPQGCKFCSTHVVYKRRWRSRAVENVIKELEVISENKKISDVFFVDDNMLVNMKRVGRLCIEIIRGKREGRIEKKLHFFFQGRLDSMAKHPYIVKLMAQAGFWLVLVGVEATDNEHLENVRKGCKIENIKKGIKVLHENGIVVMGNVIIGTNLNDTIEDVIITIKRTRELSLDFPSFTLLTPFPSTDFYQELKEKKLLLTEDYSKYNWLNPVIKTPNFTSKALQRLLFLGFFYLGFYGGNWKNKILLARRTIKVRGVKYIMHPVRVHRTFQAFFFWKKIVMKYLHDIKRNVLYQIRLGDLDRMTKLKTNIIQ